MNRNRHRITPAAHRLRENRLAYARGFREARAFNCTACYESGLRAGRLEAMEDDEFDRLGDPTHEWANAAPGPPNIQTFIIKGPQTNDIL